MHAAVDRARRFCGMLGIRIPVLLAPMAGACPPELSAAVIRAGGLGAGGVLTMAAEEIERWCAAVRGAGGDAFQLNSWVPDAPPRRDEDSESRLRAFLADWGPKVPADAGSGAPPDFKAQFEAMVAARPRAISTIMGLLSPRQAERLKAAGILWLATATTVAEAQQAKAAGADAIVAQGMEAGGHRGAFDPEHAERRLVGSLALIPAVSDATGLPVIAAGGIADGRTAAAALLLGASAVQIGTGFLRCPEAAISPAWATALAHAAPEDTMLTRAFSGRAGRSLASDYVRAAADPAVPRPAPYPVQRGLTAAMRAEAEAQGDVRRMQAWSGQSARLASGAPAEGYARGLWEQALELLGAPAGADG